MDTGLDAAWPGPIILLAGTADFSITPHPHPPSHNPYIVPPSWKWMHSWIHTFLFYLNVCHLSTFVELMAKVTRRHEDSIISKSWSRGHGYFIFHNNHDAAAVNWSSYFNREASVTRGLYSCWRHNYLLLWYGICIFILQQVTVNRLNITAVLSLEDWRKIRPSFVAFTTVLSI